MVRLKSFLFDREMKAFVVRTDTHVQVRFCILHAEETVQRVSGFQFHCMANTGAQFLFDFSLRTQMKLLVSV